MIQNTPEVEASELETLSNALKVRLSEFAERQDIPVHLQAYLGGLYNKQRVISEDLYSVVRSWSQE